MHITARKLVATAAAAALLASLVSPVALAAPITDIQVNGGTTLTATQTITSISFTASANVGSVVVEYPATLTDTNLVVGDITVNNAATDLGATGLAVNTTTNTITFSGDGASTAGLVTLTFANAHLVGPASGNITFAVSAGTNQGAAVIAVAGANQIVVSATVVPTLSMNVAGGNLSLGTLSTAVTDTTGTTDITVSTNAAGGYTLSAAATSSDGTAMPLTSRNALTAGNTRGFAAYVSGVTNATANASYDGVTAAGVLSSTPAAIASHGSAVANSVVNVKYAGEIDATTPAGSYTMTTTYTISGSF